GAGAVRGKRSDAVLRLAPGDMTEQPRARRFLGKFYLGSFGNALQIDQTMLERERAAIRQMKTFQSDKLAVLGQPFLGLAFRAADFAGQELETVSRAARDDIGADIGNGQHHGLEVLLGDKGTTPLAADQETGLNQARQRLAYRHPGAAITRHQFMFDRDAEARRPGAAENLLFDVGADLPLKGGRLGHGQAALNLDMALR